MQVGNRVLDLGGFGENVGEREVFDGLGEHGRGDGNRLNRHLGPLFLVGVSWSPWNGLTFGGGGAYIVPV